MSEGITNSEHNILDKTYPVGAIYISTVSTNPSNLLGGAWESFGQGRTLLGVGSAEENTNNDYGSMEAGAVNRTTVQERGGAPSHNLTVAQMPIHNHGQHTSGFVQESMGSSFDGSALTRIVSGSGGFSISNVNRSGGRMSSQPAGNVNNQQQNVAFVHTHANNGSGSAHNNIQPYVTVYMWRRTA